MTWVKAIGEGHTLMAKIKLPDEIGGLGVYNLMDYPCMFVNACVHMRVCVCVCVRESIMMCCYVHTAAHLVWKPRWDEGSCS